MDKPTPTCKHVILPLHQTNHHKIMAQSTNEKSQSHSSNSNMGIVQTKINHTIAKKSYFRSSKGSNYESLRKASHDIEMGHADDSIQNGDKFSRDEKIYKIEKDSY